MSESAADAAATIGNTAKKVKRTEEEKQEKKKKEVTYGDFEDALQYDSLDKILNLIDEHPLAVNTKYSHGDTALHAIAMYLDGEKAVTVAEKVFPLLRDGWECLRRQGDYGGLPLHQAALRMGGDMLPLIKWLVAKAPSTVEVYYVGRNGDATDNEGKLAYDLAAEPEVKAVLCPQGYKKRRVLDIDEIEEFDD